MVYPTPAKRLFLALGLERPGPIREYPFNWIRTRNGKVYNFYDYYLDHRVNSPTNYNEAIVSRIDCMKFTYPNSVVPHEFLLVTAYPTLDHWYRGEPVKLVVGRCSVWPVLQDTQEHTFSSITVIGRGHARDLISPWDPALSQHVKRTAHVTFDVIPNKTPYESQDVVPPGALPLFVLVLITKRAYDSSAAATFAECPFLIWRQDKPLQSRTNLLTTDPLIHFSNVWRECHGIAAGTILTKDIIRREFIAPLREDIKRLRREKDEMYRNWYAFKKYAVASLGTQDSSHRAANGSARLDPVGGVAQININAPDGGVGSSGLEGSVNSSAPIGAAGSGMPEAPVGRTWLGVDGTIQKAKRSVKKVIQKFRSRVRKGLIRGSDK
ncbi:hypothetical protein P691DRAFT_770857 [Macrolepiota fuliginosa MF-IS2]|uniref:Uncharacterized protein n=1 Tax=Macrolepiota fuliginosa MF-IS2 TaxID=1400762 RepID=A0A9P6CAH4_9AGAR|nr:hypothetical protein P691DRAFT_770857 [Macrolepiota fuliginosa MF-IS2]